MSTTVSLIYAYWSNTPLGVTWCDLPWKLRDAGMSKRLHEAGHSVIETVLMVEDDYPDDIHNAFKLARDVAESLRIAREKGELPVVVCGSCAVAALGTVTGLGDGRETGIAWFDAHPDLNTPDTTLSGLLEGMALAISTGHAWQRMARDITGLEQPANLSNAALFGVRDIEPGERTLINAAGIPVTTRADEIVSHLSKARQTYVHLDMDVHDALSVRTNAFAVPDGPTATQVRDCLVSLDHVAAMAITGLDPAAEDGNEAANIAIDHVLAVAKGWSSPSVA